MMLPCGFTARTIASRRDSGGATTRRAGGEWGAARRALTVGIEARAEAVRSRPPANDSRTCNRLHHEFLRHARYRLVRHDDHGLSALPLGARRTDSRDA